MSKPGPQNGYCAVPSDNPENSKDWVEKVLMDLNLDKAKGTYECP